MSGVEERPVTPYWSEGSAIPFLWAHRGASALAPENTIKSFLLAAELQAPGIEFDVQLTKDGIPIILHDPWIWTDGSDLVLRPSGQPAGALRRVAIAECPWADLDGKSVLHWDGSWEPIPRFEQVLETVPSEMWLDIELKSGWTYDPRLVGVVAAALSRRTERVLLSSFDHIILQEMGRATPDLPLLAICHARLVDPAQVMAAIPASMICIDRPFLTHEDVVRWRSQGIEVSIGGRELVDDLAAVMEWPVTGIFLDDPRLVLDGNARPVN